MAESSWNQVERLEEIGRPWINYTRYFSYERPNNERLKAVSI